MSTNSPKRTHFYFSTRDLLIMAVFAALGGVASTYINTLSDAVQAFLGFPGATQWAAGLHVIWIVLATAITGKTGSGTVTGIFKGTVELMSGNTHGVIILLIDLVAGLFVDFGFLIFSNKRSLFPYLIAGGLASGSNVLVFQLFATLPSNILAAGAILILFFIAFGSGVIFAGFIPSLLINSLARADVLKIQVRPSDDRKIGWYILICVIILAVGLGIFLQSAYKGPAQIQISGAVSQPYIFPTKDFNPEKVSRQMEYRGAKTEYTGYLLQSIIDFAGPAPNANTLLIEASDGYAFLISFEELQSNPNILLVMGGEAGNNSFDIVGPKSNKAWIRNVSKITVIGSEGLTIIDQTGSAMVFNPNNWVESMDSTQVALPAGNRKLQGVPVWKIISAKIKTEPQSLVFLNQDGEKSIPWNEINNNDDLRIFIVIDGETVNFAFGKMTGEVLLYPINRIEVQ